MVVEPPWPLLPQPESSPEGLNRAAGAISLFDTLMPNLLRKISSARQSDLPQARTVDSIQKRGQLFIRTRDETLFHRRDVRQ